MGRAREHRVDKRREFRIVVIVVIVVIADSGKGGYEGRKSWKPIYVGTYGLGSDGFILLPLGYGELSEFDDGGGGTAGFSR